MGRLALSRRPLLGLLLITCLVAQMFLMVGKEAEAATTVVIDWTQNRQTIDGFGGSGAFQMAKNLMNLAEPARTAVVDLLFSQTTGAGLSIIRNQVGDGDPDAIGTIPSIEPAPGVWNWNGDPGQIWLMNEAKKRGTTRFWSTVWSPPAWMKDNGQTGNGGSLSPAHYQDYADYLATYVNQYKARFGLDIYAISPANEPDFTAPYPSCRWTGQQFHDFILNNLKPTFRRNSVPAKVMLPETSFWDESLAQESLDDPNTNSRVNIVAAHNYSWQPNSLFPNAKAYGKKIWQTEVSFFSAFDPSMADGMTWAKQVHDFMTRIEANAWHYWWLASNSTDAESLIQMGDPGTQNYTVSKRLFTIGNFSRFVRPGYIRLNTTANPLPNVYVSSYKDPSTGKFAVVVINDSASNQSLKFSLSGFNTSSVTPYITSATQNLQAQSKVQVSNRAFSVTIPPQSVVTYTGTRY